MEFEEKIQLYLKVGVVAVSILAIIGAFFVGLISTEVFISIIGPIIGYYFSDRRNNELHRENRGVIEALKLSNPVLVNLDVKKQIQEV